MNERIQELAEQAGITTNLDTEYFEKDMNKWVDYFSEKFAELIVRECAELVETQHTWITSVAASALIRKHFGVRE